MAEEYSDHTQHNELTHLRPEPVVLTAGERADIAQVFHGCRWLSPERAECIERILADRLAADRAAHEALREAAVERVNATHHFHGNECLCGFSSARSRSRTEHITAALAATAPTPPQDGPR